MIERRLLFGPPERHGPSISPDGKHLAFLAPYDGLLNIWVAPLRDPDAGHAISRDVKRPILFYFWAYTSGHILYVQDVAGDEEWHLQCVDLKTGSTTDLTPQQGISARLYHRSRRFPKEILVGINQRDPVYHDLFRVDIESGEQRLVFENRCFTNFAIDEDYRVRFGYRFEDDGSQTVHGPDDNGDFAEVRRIPMEDTFSNYHCNFDKSGRLQYAIDSGGRNTSALVLNDLENNETKVLATNDLADISGLLTHPVEKTIQAVATTYLRKEWVVLDPELTADFALLNSVCDGDMTILGRSDDDAHWIVQYLLDNGPIRFYLYDRAARRASFLFAHRPALERLPLAKMHPEIIRSRDGLDLVSYLTLPNDQVHGAASRPRQPVPMVLQVHGGPWGRDSWGFHAWHQLLANRGYAVLSVNFRGSTGFGKDFVNAATGEFGARMNDDLVDAVNWAVDEGIAIPDRVAITGVSYGGYATLVGLAMTPDVFACGVCFAGISNLVTFLDSMPPYWENWASVWKTRAGDHTTDEGRAFLLSRSPINHVDRIRKPLLIAHGANDVRCKQAEADQIVAAVRETDVPVTYLLYPDEGHGFYRPENNISSFAVMEAFLAKHIGGRSEPVGDALADSSVEVVCGGDVLA